MNSKQQNPETNPDIISKSDSESTPETISDVVDESISDAASEVNSETTDEVIEELAEYANSENESEEDEEDDVYSLEKCLNCGTELNGIYCHNCGQHITDHAMTVKQFILSYLDNTFLWDPQHLKTIWKLISRPGLLTKEYIAGKFVSQVQPLKLNMFLVVVFLTLFVFLGSDQRLNNTMKEITHDEMVFSSLQLEGISADEDYMKKIKNSPRDTVKIIAPIHLTKEYPHIISAKDIIFDSEGDVHDKWVAIVPHVFIEEEILKLDNDGCYRFNTEVGIAAEDVELFDAIAEQMSSLAKQYFPIFLLLTAPLLAFSLRLVQFRKRRSFFTHFIFSMHYIAFVELVIIIIYLIHHFFQPSLSLLNDVFAICSCVYFAIAFRRVYGTSWFRSVTKSLVSSLIYYMICLLIFMALVFIACVIVAAKLEFEA